MKVLRMTTVRPLHGHEEKVTGLLQELGGYLSRQPGCLADYETRSGDGTLGRVSLWASKEDADRAANQLHTIALRAKLHAWTFPDRQEHLVEVVGESPVPAAAA